VKPTASDILLTTIEMSAASAPTGPRPLFQSPIPTTMAVPAPLTVRLPPLREDEGEAHPCEADEPHGPAPVEIAPATALPAPPVRPTAARCEMCGVIYELGDRADGLPFCSYECASGGGSSAPPQPTNSMWVSDTCCGCRLPNAECRCYGDFEDYEDDGDESPPGRRCPVCGCHFEGNEWFGFCSRSCARRDR